MSTSKCNSCSLFYKIQSMHSLNCNKHWICKSCHNLNQIINCQLCNSFENNLVNSENRVERIVEYNYPIQGMLVHFDKQHNPMGVSEFSSITNCHQRTIGWLMCTLLGIIFFIAGLSLAIKTNQLGIGIILSILGIIDIIVSIFFIFKVHKVDSYYQQKQYIVNDGEDDNFRQKRQIRNNNRLMISSVHSEDDVRQIQMVKTDNEMGNKV